MTGKRSVTSRGRMERPTSGPPAAEHPLGRVQRDWLMQAVRRATSAICRLTFEGRHHVPADGAFLLIFNHTSNFDPPLLLAATPRHDLIGLVAASYRQRAWARFFVEASGSVWLERGVGDRGALTLATQALHEGVPVGISPEGGRGRGSAVRRAKPGVAAIADHAGVPIVPAGIVGANRISRALWRGRRTEVRIRFGEAFRPTARPDLARKARLQAQADEAMARVVALLPRDYHGVYAGLEARAEAPR
ncbi:MAG: 1-acyl-sn-glycerol-3-phosphate acyltransferase [Gemmatimonadetes bacterium]|nr:1-acyl-sn-glycerol-3-phosphate acyltransferase [Gemmatimonadota bacterium]NNM32806.1 1-acyl-sn-glycerol-3-phosphate acyltransferase [Gemmatimonadota bacterium]